MWRYGSGQFKRVEGVISRIESDAGEESLGEKVYHAFISGRGWMPLFTQRYLFLQSKHG